MQDSSLGVYISVPFCRSKCTYCNFASGVYPASDQHRYVDRLLEDLTAARDRAPHDGVSLPRAVDTIYLGGGTPTLLSPENIARLFRGLRSAFSVEPDAEITVECAPGQISAETLQSLVDAGVNRMSLGVQSFIDREARETGRLHTRAMVLDDLERLRGAGICNLNIDLIAGLPGQTFSSWNESLDVLLACGVPHASVYMLEVDEDSRLGREILSGGARYHAGLVPNDDSIARMYETAIDRLQAAGLSQYEISNFAQPGRASRHNLRYWLRRPYLGLGLDASSMLREAPGSAALDAAGSGPARVRRFKTGDDLNGYLGGAAIAESEWLSLEEQHEEAWFLGLRMNQGVQISSLVNEFGQERVQAGVEVARQLAADGLLQFDQDRIRLTPEGRLLSNEVFQQFIGLAAVVENA